MPWLDTPTLYFPSPGFLRELVGSEQKLPLHHGLVFVTCPADTALSASYSCVVSLERSYMRRSNARRCANEEQAQRTLPRGRVGK